jgi:hypothetical protein
MRRNLKKTITGENKFFSHITGVKEILTQN